MDISQEDYDNFLNKVIEDGIASATRDYAKYPDKLEGAVGGFNACRNKSTDDLTKLLQIAYTAVNDAREKGSESYWKFRCYAGEIEWVCNCISALMFATKKPLIVSPTARGYLKMIEVLGIKVDE